MSVHDWTRVDAGIFHAFHHGWIAETARELNRWLPKDPYYALPQNGLGTSRPSNHIHDVPKWYANKKKSVAVHQITDHRVAAVLEIVSFGNKDSRGSMRTFVNKAQDLLSTGIQLAILDLFPPTPRDPEGIHPVIRSEDDDGEYQYDPAHPLTCAAYVGGADAEACVEPVAVGDVLPDWPRFLLSDVYFNVPLEATYRAAFDALPAFLRDDLNATLSP